MRYTDVTIDFVVAGLVQLLLRLGYGLHDLGFSSCEGRFFSSPEMTKGHVTCSLGTGEKTAGA